MKVLITGGAGFIGSHLAKRLAKDGAEVTVLDNLSEQIHGADTDFAPDLRRAANCIYGDICDREQLTRAIRGQDAVVHLAAETGTGQSMYAVGRYSRVNLQGTATLLDILVNRSSRSVQRLVVASSRAVYGEGAYRCASHGRVHPSARTAEAMAAGRFDPICPVCGGDVSVLATQETAPLGASSFYGLTKQAQEQMVLLFGRSMGINAFAVRYQNVYGPGQSLANPYTGLLAAFSNLARAGRDLNVFEDGLESRDFVHVEDVVEATASCLAPTVSGHHALNVGSGEATPVIEVANAVIRHFGSTSRVRVTGDFRVGDIRHNLADISQIRAVTGFVPRRRFRDGVVDFLDWAGRSAPVDAGFDRSMRELRERGLLGVRATADLDLALAETALS
ncbi:SDR family NAD(P)-dependent oxidoreductase [Belnapia sp. T18]|uniref:SDR family NAD(P)-dependent oxidoreductase n=1 Tax=Belnapia arida TaxID=2804533 RepID=A0ABS1UAD7_9PROT|nr:SDR family NAD(P)-dependent oxidoreductase [Belnapia arida]MBL6081085.1 SDR family NAD(P)-dependent oxidoreductase [Belnapia arida]